MTSTWLSEVFRLTAFFAPSDDIESTKWWKHVTGEEPTNRNSQPKNKLFQDEGPYAGGYLVVTIQPGRADWLFFPSFDNRLGIADLNDLQPFDIKKEISIEIANRWFEICPSILRIAFGTILNIRVPDRSSGYVELSKYLPAVEIDTENSSDFMYQINRTRSSKTIPELSINRLSKWATAVVELGAFSPIIGSDNTISKDTSYYARLEIDVNTVHGYKKPLPRENYSLIFNELVDLASEIKEKGDVK